MCVWVVFVWYEVTCQVEALSRCVTDAHWNIVSLGAGACVIFVCDVCGRINLVGRNETDKTQCAYTNQTINMSK